MDSETFEEMLIVIGKNVQKYRVKQDMTLLNLSEKTGISQNMLKKIEKGDCIGASIMKNFRLADGLNVKPLNLFKK